MATLLHDNPELLEILEADLRNKIVYLMNKNSLSSVVDGVFSLDDLENKTHDSIAMGMLAFGVAYQGCQPVNEAEAKRSNVDHGSGAQMGFFHFSVIIAARVDAMCSQRTTASRILTILRRGILQSEIPLGNRGTRTWGFVQERPEIADSTKEMLYYSQVWRICLPMTHDKE